MKTIIEPFRIKVVEAIRMTTREEREEQQLALPHDPEGVPRGTRQARRRGNRHAGPHPPDPTGRGHEGDPLDGDGRHAAPARQVRAYPGLVGRDLIPFVTCEKTYLWKDNGPRPIELLEKTKSRLRVVVIDCSGVKYNILRNLEKRGCDVVVDPARSTAPEIRAYDPDGVLLSNRPGDPATLPYIVNTVQELLGQTPIFGICLGHQILGQALGAVTAKLKFGHHGTTPYFQPPRFGRQCTFNSVLSVHC